MKKFVWVGVILIIGLVFYLSQSGEESVESFINRIEKAREEKLDFLKNSNQSPFYNVSESVGQLNYFKPDPAYKVRAKIKQIESRSYLNLGVSTGETEKYLKYAYAEFEIEGVPMRLLLLKKATGRKNEPIFTAFADETSGSSTYGGGRYLDLDFKNARSIDIDFNLAYNPYCAYIDSYSCPFPPKENILPIAINAGEKSYH